MRKLTSIADGGVVGSVGVVCMMTILLWIVFYVAVPLTILAMQIIGDAIGVSTQHWDLNADIFQPSVFAASFVSAVIVVVWDRGISARYREKEVERVHVLIHALELEHGFKVTEEAKKEIFASLSDL